MSHYEIFDRHLSVFAVPDNPFNSRSNFRADFPKTRLSGNIRNNTAQAGRLLFELKERPVCQHSRYSKRSRPGRIGYDPSDSLKLIADENGIGHDEVVGIYAETTGNYKIQVIWNLNRPLSGKYQITLEQIEKAGATPALKLQQLFDSWYKKNAPGAAVAVIKNNQVVFRAPGDLPMLKKIFPLRAHPFSS